MNKKRSIKDFVKTWLLVFAMSAGGIGYFLLDGLVNLRLNRLFFQPVLIFLALWSTGGWKY